MSTATVVAEPPVQLAPAHERPRARWGLPLLAAALALGGLLASAVLVAPARASVALGGLRVTGAPFVMVPEYGPRGAYVLGYVHQARVQISLPVRNDGPLPLTVHAIRLLTAPAPLLTLDHAEGLDVHLRPGQTTTVQLSGILGNCRYSNERDLQTYDRLEVTGSTLGRDVTRSVLLDRPVYVKSPMIVTCPDRKLDRSAVNRSDLL